MSVPPRLLRVLLRIYPRRFRERWREEILRFWRAQWEEPRYAGVIGRLRYAADLAWDALGTALRLRLGLRESSPPRWPSTPDGPPPGELTRLPGGRGVLPGWRADLRSAFATVRRHPGFTAVVVGTLALGIGATTAIFSVLQSVLLDELPYHDPDALRVVWTTGFTDGRTGLAPKTALELRDRNRVFEDLTLVRPVISMNAVASGRPETVRAQPVGANFFQVLGVGALRGRTFSDGVDQPGAPLEVVLSHTYWIRRFGGDPSVLGTTMSLNGQSYQVVGVMPEGFELPLYGEEDIWTPRVLSQADLDVRSYFSDKVLGRLSPGVTDEQVASELDRIADQFTDAMPDIHGNLGLAAGALHQEVVKEARTVLWMLFAAVALVLLVAWANVANLLLTRNAARASEIAVRRSMGASRGRLVRQLVLEALLLAGAGGLLGTALAAGAIPVLLSVAPTDIPRLDAVRPDAGLLAFALLLSLGTGLIFGLPPALRGSRDTASALRSGDRRSTLGRRGRRLLSGVVALEAAMVAVLLVGSGLTLRTLNELTSTDPGFEVTNRTRMRLELAPERYPDVESMTRFLDELLPAVRALPGVRAAGTTSTLPLTSTGITIPGPVPSGETLPENRVRARWDDVTPGFFEAMGIPVLAGRAPAEHDLREGEQVIVLNRTLADELFPGGDPVGRSVGWSSGSDSLMIRVVGVVGDVQHLGLRKEPMFAMYVPQRQASFAWPVLELAVWAPGVSSATLAEALRRLVRETDPQQAVTSLTPLTAVLRESVREDRFRMRLLVALGLTSLLLGAVGVYAVVRYGARSRLREIAVRKAVGAPAGRIFTTLLVGGVAPVTVGLAAGLVGSIFAARWGSTFLYEVEPGDPATLAVAAGVLAGVALVASWLPAREAARTDPARTLRSD